MDFLQLEAFYTVAKEKSFHKAAESLHLSQPAISSRIANLEQYLQVSLFHRDGKKVELTEYGEILMGYAERILALASEGRNAIQFARLSQSNKLSIGTTNRIAAYTMPKLLEQFYRKFSDIEVTLHTATRSDRIMQLLEEGSIQVAIANLKTDLPHYEKVLLEEDEIILICSPDYPLYRCYSDGKAHLGEMLSKFVYIGFRPSSTFYRSLIPLFKQYNIQPKRYITVDNTESMKKIALSKLGVAFLPKNTVREELAEGTLVEIPMTPKQTMKVETYILYPTNRKLSSAARHFVDFTRQFFKVKTG